jgi:hypothetical protein
MATDTTEGGRRWLWFAGLYIAGVLTVAGAAYGMHWLLEAIAG